MESTAVSVCRICQGEEEPLIRPCRCEGSMAYAHPYCLAEWIVSHGQLSCEVCGTAYSFQVAVRDAPLLYSVRGAALVAVLFIHSKLRPLLLKVGFAGRIVACLVILTLSSTVIWLCFWRCVARGGHTARGRRIPLPLLFVAGFVLNIVPGILLVCYERLKEWAFVYEDAIEDLPAAPPAPPPPEAPIDEAVAAALNSRFTNKKHHHSSSTPSPDAHRYVAARQTDVSAGLVLQLLRKKVNDTKKPSRRRSVWDNTALCYIATCILIHVAFASAFLLGDATLQYLALLARLLSAMCRRLAVTNNSVLWVPLTEALAAVPFSILYWCSAFIVGVATLLYPLQLTAAHLASTRVPLSRTLALVCVFTRSTLHVTLLMMIWAIVLPVVVYACLLPFFVEGDATVFMAPKEAWQVLRRERLLPFTCRGASSSPSLPPMRPVTQPLNVLRALFFVASDVWHGQVPPLFDPVSCGLATQDMSPQGLPSHAVHFACFCGCVLLRVCTLATWLTLVGTLRATFLWLFSGAFTVLHPYLSIANAFHSQHDFFHTFIHLRGRSFWRVLAEIPASVALYTITVGFATFATLYRYSPDTFPRSMSYLSFYTLTSRFSEFDFVYSWHRIINAIQIGVQTGLQRLFLSSGASSFENSPDSQGNQVVERAAYGVSLLCANVLVGIVIERASWSSWFPLLGFFLNLVCLSWIGVDLRGLVPNLRRRLTGCGMQATMLCFYGTWVSFREGDACVCKKLSRVRSNIIIFSLLRQSFEQNDVRLLILLTQLLDSHHKEDVVCSRELLHRVTTHTLAHVATYRRMVAAAILIVVAPLWLCSAWHVNFVTWVSTDYVALPLWFSLLVRWMTGALAGGVWMVAEGLVLRTALFQRSLEFVPQFILGTPSLEAVHAVLIPLVIHCSAVRMVIAVLEDFSHSAVAVSYRAAPLTAGAALILLSVAQGRVKTALWRVGRRAVLEGVQPEMQVVPPVDPAHFLVVDLQQRPVPRQPPLVEPAVVLHDVAVAAAAAAADEPEAEGPHAAPPAEVLAPEPNQWPPQPQPHPKSKFLRWVQERIARWAASEGATDVVLVDYADPAASLASS